MDHEPPVPTNQLRELQGPRPATTPLDLTVRLGWSAWSRAAARTGVDATLDWLSKRLADDDLIAASAEPLAVLLSDIDLEERAVAATELAELLEVTDDVLADTLWEGVLAYGRKAEDADFMFEATTHLAIIAERHGDVLAAAEFYIDFLNWRRQGDHSSETESVESAFEEIIRLAEADDSRRAAALYSFYQVRYHNLAETDDEPAVTGDWESSPEPYEGWQ